jgi:hypothetical protein
MQSNCDEAYSKLLWEKLVLAWLYDVGLTEIKVGGRWVVEPDATATVRESASEGSAEIDTLDSGSEARVTKGHVDDTAVLWLQLGAGRWAAANDGSEVILRPKGRPELHPEDV